MNASLKALLGNVLRFQAAWFACVLGGFWAALIAGPIVIGWHLRYHAHPHEWRFITGFAGLGLILDGSLAMLGGFEFADAPLMLGPLPLWLWMLWPLFATLVFHSLTWLWRHPWLAVAGGAISGPLSYYSGALLAGVSTAPWLLPVQAVIWGAICLALAYGQTPLQRLLVSPDS